jgi:hypothetical protein
MSQQHVFKVGDRVSFTMTRKTSECIKISSRDGRIAAISDDTAVVAYRNKKFIRPLSGLRPVGHQSALTEEFLNMCKQGAPHE